MDTERLIIEAHKRVTRENSPIENVVIDLSCNGGSCVVRPLSTASGTLFQISGPNRLAFTKNGSFYNIDQGMEPDVYIDDIDHYYDREALTEFINNIY